jgi:hypothetical protein
VAAAIYEYPSRLGQRILAAADYYSPTQIVSEFQEVTGKQAQFVQVDNETYKSFLPPNLADEMLENHLLLEDPGYYAGESLQDSLQSIEKIGLRATTWKEFLEKNAASFS